uniref:Fibronectin type-III domain-containing protein n=1 Tax=Serinus canaria TaxID=9135 RepID=A0A8C9MDP3_SERCA
PPVNPEAVDKTKNSVDLSWQPPRHDGNGKIIGYLVEFQKVGDEEWKQANLTADSCPETNYKVTGLTEGLTYKFRVKAVNAAGESDPAHRSDHGKYIITAKNSCGQAQGFAIVNVLDRPGPCQNLKISYVTKDSCMISWESPVDNGGSEITNYIVEYRQPNQRGWSIVASDITKRLVKANLVENREYFFRVCAENKIGPGPCIETKTPILAINPIDKPGEPENLHIAEKGKTFVYLKWRRPDYDGGSPNLSYHVERKLKDSDEWERVHKGSIKETHYMVDKCVENKIYQFRVQTKNEAGESNWVKTAEVVVKEDLQKPVEIIFCALIVQSRFINILL